MLFWDFVIFPLSIKENFTLGLKYKYSRLSEIIKKVGLKEKINNFTNNGNAYLVKKSIMKQLTFLVKKH